MAITSVNTAAGLVVNTKELIAMATDLTILDPPGTVPGQPYYRNILEKKRDAFDEGYMLKYDSATTVDATVYIRDQDVGISEGMIRVRLQNGTDTGMILKVIRSLTANLYNSMKAGNP